MSERYIERDRLGPQQFPLNCPVKLAAGALLEDTKQPRLVGQLKFTPTKRMVTALSVTLHCEGAAETDLPFRYEALSAAPGQSFGQYTAIVLPAGTTAFRVRVDTVTFKDGSQWDRAEEEAREQARQEAAALREEQRRQAKQEATEKAAAMKAAAEEKLAQKKAEIQRKAEEKQAKKAETGTDTASAKSKGKGIAVVAAVLVVVIIAGIILVPKLLKNNSSVPAEPTPEVTTEPTPTPTPKPSPTPKPVNTDFGETGDIATVYLTKDDGGYYSLTPDQITPYLENATTTCARMGRDLGDDVMTYLKDSFSFAWFVGAGGPNSGISGDGTMYPQGNGDLPETVCVLAFNGYENTLVGYFIGIPEQYDEDTLCFDMVLCDYELLDLYEQERAAFDADKDFLYENYISPDSDFEALGAKYYLQGYYTCETGNLEDDDVQAYHLWQEITNADHVEDFARDIRRLKDRLSENDNRDRTMFFLLLDKKYHPIGITWQ